MAPALEQALPGAFEDPAPRVVLDLRELEFVDSSGLRTLLIADRQAVAARKDFALVAGHRGLERTLEIAGVRGIFEWTSPNELT